MDSLKQGKARWCLENGITAQLTDHGTYYPVRYDGCYPVRVETSGQTMYWMTPEEALVAAYDLLNPGKVPDVVVLPVALTAPWLEARKRHHAAWLNHEDDKTPAIRREIEKHADALAAALTQGGELPHADQSKD